MKRSCRTLYPASILIGTLACGPSTEGSASLRDSWPGVYTKATSVTSMAGRFERFVFEFREDRTAVTYKLECSGRRLNEVVWDWRATDGSTVELIIVEGQNFPQPAGTVYEVISVRDAPCGPHEVAAENASPYTIVAGHYCPTNIIEDVTGQQICDFEACDARARMCVEEAGNGT